jgi:hypothetical protein
MTGLEIHSLINELPLEASGKAVSRIADVLTALNDRVSELEQALTRTAAVPDLTRATLDNPDRTP